MPLKDGQQVLVKIPHSVVGTVVRERAGDRDLPEDQRRYKIRIPEQEFFYLPSDFEVIESPPTKLERFSPEWSAEVSRWVTAGQQLVANQNDHSAFEEFCDSGRKIGFIVPKA